MRISETQLSGGPLVSLPSSSASLSVSSKPVVSKTWGMRLGRSEVSVLMIAALGMENSTVSSGMSAVATKKSHWLAIWVCSLKCTIGSAYPAPIPLPAPFARRSSILMLGWKVAPGQVLNHSKNDADLASKVGSDMFPRTI